MTAVEVGPARLFDVEPDPVSVYEVRDHTVRRVIATSDLAAAIYAAAGTASTTRRTAWLICPDRWSVPITHNGTAYTIGTTNDAPIDAISRVLNLTPSTGANP